MKIVKKSIALPEDLSKFVDKQTARLAKERGTVPNRSAYYAMLVRKAMEEIEAKQAA
ncbi:MAG: hypothetical protein KGL39_27945 [Patescibacteria group bacterium]|nr:hypothetical protein [Patescibacteria group bacterium]